MSRQRPWRSTAMQGGIFEQAHADLPPVRDVHGHIVRFVLVPPGEKTCTNCGETTFANYCVRCGDIEHNNPVSQLVPTTSYLREDEYVAVA